MLIALPNTDGSFTATLFLARTGAPSFAALGSAAAVTALFSREFPDALPLLPDLAAQFAAHPQGQLGTVHTEPWHVGGEVLLLGDAAHAIVPFHGQGMNAAFEDCSQLDELLGGDEDWAARSPLSRPRGQPTPRRSRAWRSRTTTRCAMRCSMPASCDVARSRWRLERRFPGRFIPRYSMVMFHPEIPYAEALRRGAVQETLLRELDAGPGAEPDPALAERLVTQRLSPL